MKPFSHVKATDEQMQMMQRYRDHFFALYSAINNENIPKGRQLSLAITKLEESAMWLNKAICQPEVEV